MIGGLDMALDVDDVFRHYCSRSSGIATPQRF
jgi:hypothetical protein